jgi:hypothetical protein
MEFRLDFVNRDAEALRSGARQAHHTPVLSALRPIIRVQARSASGSTAPSSTEFGCLEERPEAS